MSMLIYNYHLFLALMQYYYLCFIIISQCVRLVFQRTNEIHPSDNINLALYLG